ncbi:MAG: PAS domain S-box protein [Bacteroidota bacterium]
MMNNPESGDSLSDPIHSSTGTASPRILIAEDEQIVAADIRERLTKLGYSVPAVAASGEDAVALATEIKPDLLLIDIVLQGSVDGIEAVKRIRAQLDVPVIYLTAYADQGTVHRAKETEPLGYLLKPFDERELRFAIEMALHKHQADARLRRREEKFRQLADNPQEVLWMVDAETNKMLYVSPADESIRGTVLQMPGADLDTWLEPIHSDERQKALEMISRAQRGEIDEKGYEYRIVRPDGTIRWISSRSYPIRDASGRVYRIAGTSVDITRQKWAWETLRESEERYRLLAENATDIISRHGPEGVFLYVSPASRSLLGYRPEELLGTSAYSHIHPEDLENVRRRDSDGGHFLSAGTEAFRMRKKDGGYVWLEAAAKTVRHPDTGEIREIIVVTREISDRKWAEDVLARYEFIANASQELMTLINRNYVYEAANDAYCEAHVKTRSQIIGQTVSDIWGEETFDAIIKPHLDDCFSGTVTHYDSWFEFSGLGRRYYAVNYYPYVNPDGIVTHCVVVSHDITDRKTDEDDTHSSLQEKEILLKEIHHRVKNNLQIISSLLSLQSNTIESEATRELVRESQNRVRSMALIHEKLYQSASLARIDFGEYLRNLTRDLFRSYSAGGVSLKLQAEDISLDIDAAIPCGLMVNELVSNALKYAFAQTKGGELLITFSQVARDKFALSVTDNGVGLPSDLDVRNPRSLGLQLVNMLVAQLRGTLDVVSDGGTTFMITFSSGGFSVHAPSQPVDAGGEIRLS